LWSLFSLKQIGRRVACYIKNVRRRLPHECPAKLQNPKWELKNKNKTKTKEAILPNIFQKF